MSEHRQAFRPVVRSSHTKRLLVIPLALFSFALSGCGPRRVRVDFTGYEKSYANTSNQEVLLNLARLAHHDPTYFFKLGQISSTYQMQVGLSGFGSYVPSTGSAGTVEAPSAGGTPTAGYQNYSAFNFIPVSDQTTATLLLQPVSEDVFYNLYQQGWRVDQLFRLLVDRIEIELPVDPKDPGKGCRVEVIPNEPPPDYFASSGYSLSPRLLSRYVEFLRVSAIVYALQRHGFLQITGSDTFVPVDRNGKLTTPPTGKDMTTAAANGEVWELKDGTWLLGKKALRPRFQLGFTNPSAFKESQYGDNVSELNAMLEEVLQHDPGLNQLSGQEGAPELTDILEILYKGFAIGGSASGADNGDEPEVRPCEQAQAPEGASSQVSTGNKGSSQRTSPLSGLSAHLVMRSLLGLMGSAAQEQPAFDALMEHNPVFSPFQDSLICEVHKALRGATPPNAKDLIEGLCPAKPPSAPGLTSAAACSPPSASRLCKSFKVLVPNIEQLPVLRLTWPKQVSPQFPLPPANDAASLKRFGLSVNYRGADYWISDFKVSDGDLQEEGSKGAQSVPVWAEEDQSWNRDMFRLICQLQSQVSVDISKFPLPSILQLPIQ